MLFLGFLTQLGQHAACRFGVKEGDVKPFGATAGSLVDKSYTFLCYFVKCIGNTVGHGKGYMMNAFSPFFNKLGNGTFVRGGFKELDFRYPPP